MIQGMPSAAPTPLRSPEPPPLGDLRSVELGAAGPEDDGELRRLLREHPLCGTVSLSFEREPSFFEAQSLEGDRQQTVLAKEAATGWGVSFFTRAERPAFVDGEPDRVATLSHLRMTGQHHESRPLVTRSLEWARRLTERGDASVTLARLPAENPIVSLLAEGGPGVPRLTRAARLHTLALLVWRRKGWRSRFELRRGRAEDLPEIAACLQRNLRRRQFAPCWTAEDLADRERCRGLNPEDFTVALGGGRVIACVAVWDQESFKQAVIHDYREPLRRWRRLVNLAAPLLDLPRMPRPGDPFPHAFLSHLAVDDDDPELARAVVARAYDDAHDRGYGYLALGLAEDDPLREPLAAAFRHLTYRSDLYTVRWPDDRSRIPATDRPAHLELATF